MPTCARRWATAALGLLLLACPQIVRAQERLAVPASCGSEAELAREIAALRVGREPSPAPEVRMRADGALGFLLEVDLPAGTRTLRDRDCRSLFRAAVVIAALGDEAQAEAPEPSQAQAEPGTAAALTPPPPKAPGWRRESKDRSAAAEPRPRAASAPPVRELAPFVSALLGHGLVPRFDLVLGAGLSARRGWLAGRVFVSYLSPRSAHEGEAGVRVDGLSGSATLELATNKWLRPGLGGDYHLLRGRGLGVSRTRSDWAALATLHAGLTLRIIRIGPLQLELSARGLYAPRRSHFRIRGQGDVYTTARFGVQAGLTLAWPL